MTAYIPMYRQRKKLSDINNPDVLSVMNDLIFDIDSICNNYFQALTLNILSKRTNLSSLVSNFELNLSTNFPIGEYTTSQTVGSIVEMTCNPDFMANIRNQLIVAFCCAIERTIKGLCDIFSISIDKGDDKALYQDDSGYYHESKPIKLWMKLFNQIIKPSGIEYFREAVAYQAVSYWQHMFWARNKIVHCGGIGGEKQIFKDGKVWRCLVKGDPIRTEHNKIDCVVQFIDNSFCYFINDIDQVLSFEMQK